ncbi:unnamed protein product [Durusdinium trenchii]|uniref:Uncharacterized protein n=2 Tax=Durusdinium trenchii TaxID=1381693 RepID=A0ABP0KUA7_9DINO
MRLNSQVELDVTSLRVAKISTANPNFAQEVEAWKSGHVGQRVPKYFLLYIRIAGASQRGLSKLCIAKLPYVLVAPKAKPPVESKQDVQASRLLARINAGTTCYTDGNRSWKAVAKDVKKQILVKSVSHRNAQFTNNLKGPKRKGASAIGGTQQLDRCWHHLKRFVACNLKTKVKSQINAAILDKAFQFVWRYNASTQDATERLASL